MRHGRHPAAARERAIIDRHTRHLARLVDDLFDISRVTRDSGATFTVDLPTVAEVRPPADPPSRIQGFNCHFVKPVSVRVLDERVVHPRA